MVDRFIDDLIESVQSEQDSQKVHILSQGNQGEQIDKNDSSREFFDYEHEHQQKNKLLLSNFKFDSKKEKVIVIEAFNFVEDGDAINLLKHIEANPLVSMLTMFDKKGYSLMHMVCFKNDEESAFKLMERAYQTYNEAQIKEWLNTKTLDDGFTALHFASFRGNLTIAQLLLKYGADVYARNNFGIDMMHVSAQGD